tara:strand:- start:770 stop:1228 length:459 start_codon:yes stop_codon:yes gene_type:complete
MKPFRFTLESVHRLRKEAVDRANDQLAREMLLLRREKQNLQRIEERMEQARVGFREAVTSGEQSQLIVQLRQFMVSLEQERKTRRTTFEAHQARVDACQKVVIAARRKLEIIEKIKSKRLAEYECDKSSWEQKELDDLLVQGRSREMNLNYA